MHKGHLRCQNGLKTWQWHLLANIQRTIVEDRLTLDRFLKVQYNPQINPLAKSTNEWLNNAKKKGKMHPKLHVKFIQVLDFGLWALTTKSN